MEYNLSNPYESLKIREFKSFLIFRLSLMISALVQSVAVGWQMYDITKDPLSLGFIGLAEAIPSILVSLYAGHIADNSDRRKIVLTCLTGFFFCALALFSFSLDSVKEVIGFSIYHLYFVIFLSGIFRGFMSPSSNGLLTQIVPKELYLNSSVWSSSAFQIGIVCGPAIGGLMYGFLGISWTYLIDSILILIALISMLTIKKKAIPKSEKEQSMFESISEGLKFVFSNQLILAALSLDMFAVLFGGATALLPVFADQVLNTGPVGLGILRSAPAVGALLMSFLMAHKQNKQNAGRNLLLAVAGFGICMIMFGLSTNFYLSLFLLAISGMLDNVSVVVRATIIQTMTPPHMMGRVSAVNSIFIGSSNEIGEFESGVAAKFWGLVPSVVFGGCMTLLVVAITSIKADKLRKLDFSNNNKLK